jgi:hypothetical protein
LTLISIGPGILRGLKLVRSRLDRAFMHGWQTTESSPISKAERLREAYRIKRGWQA